MFEGATSRGELIVTFLALLEMTRLRMTRLEQEGPLQPITIELALVDPGVMEEAALSAEASFQPRPSEADEPAPEEPEADDEENALATRGDAAPAPSFADENPELLDSEQNDEDEP